MEDELDMNLIREYEEDRHRRTEIYDHDEVKKMLGL